MNSLEQRTDSPGGATKQKAEEAGVHGQWVAMDAEGRLEESEGGCGPWACRTTGRWVAMCCHFTLSDSQILQLEGLV